MARGWSLVLMTLLALACLGCGQLTPRQRLTRALVVTGAAVGLTGGVLAVGCVRDNRPGLCSGEQGDGAFKVGLPLLAVGAALITTGLLIRPPKVRSAPPAVTRHATPAFGDSFGPPPLQGY